MFFTRYIDKESLKVDEILWLEIFREFASIRR